MRDFDLDHDKYWNGAARLYVSQLHTDLSTSNENLVSGWFFDMRKAYDTLDNTTLLRKLEKEDVHISWDTSYCGNIDSFPFVLMINIINKTKWTKIINEQHS